MKYDPRIKSLFMKYLASQGMLEKYCKIVHSLNKDFFISTTPENWVLELSRKFSDFFRLTRTCGLMGLHHVDFFMDFRESSERLRATEKTKYEKIIENSWEVYLQRKFIDVENRRKERLKSINKYIQKPKNPLYTNIFLNKDIKNIKFNNLKNRNYARNNFRSSRRVFGR